jgi:biotin-(acetyl-CoA carboxylase) ligase
VATAHRTGREPVQTGMSSPTSLDGPASSLALSSFSPRFIRLDEVDSTNAYASRRLPEISHGTFVTAAELAVIDRPATSLSVCAGRLLDVAAIAQDVAARFLDRLATTQLGALRREVLAKMTGIGDPIKVVGPQGMLLGTAVGLAEDLRLQVRDDRGCMHWVSGGDVCVMG